MVEHEELSDWFCIEHGQWVNHGSVSGVQDSPDDMTFISWSLLFLRLSLHVDLR